MFSWIPAIFDIQREVRLMNMTVNDLRNALVRVKANIEEGRAELTAKIEEHGASIAALMEALAQSENLPEDVAVLAAEVDATAQSLADIIANAEPVPEIPEPDPVPVE